MALCERGGFSLSYIKSHGYSILVGVDEEQKVGRWVEREDIEEVGSWVDEYVRSHSNRKNDEEATYINQSTNHPPTHPRSKGPGGRDHRLHAAV